MGNTRFEPVFSISCPPWVLCVKEPLRAEYTGSPVKSIDFSWVPTL
uniref:Uncharacterized protein n=1 Tax=Anguilla anguilla TaxID=7936 RepID=A0A0E9RAR8_ANGAN